MPIVFVVPLSAGLITILYVIDLQLGMAASVFAVLTLGPACFVGAVIAEIKKKQGYYYDWGREEWMKRR